MPKRRRLLYKEVIADGDTVAIVSMSGTCSCSIFVTITAGTLVPTKDFLS
jgi:ABC-type thiamine transport system ATPase subunit